jgi:tryptophan-rich sensory protein
VRGAFAVGAGSLAAGIVLYVATALVSLNSYDQVAKPAWLVALSIVAVVLAALGLLVMANIAIRVYRERN